LANKDRHDSNHDSLEVKAEAAFLEAQTRSCTAVDVNEDGVRCFLHVCPSDDLKDQFGTNEPAVCASVVALAFVIACSMCVIVSSVDDKNQWDGTNRVDQSREHEIIR
jgi:hypothetical protein